MAYLARRLPLTGDVFYVGGESVPVTTVPVAERITNNGDRWRSISGQDGPKSSQGRGRGGPGELAAPPALRSSPRAGAARLRRATIDSGVRDVPSTAAAFRRREWLGSAVRARGIALVVAHLFAAGPGGLPLRPRSQARTWAIRAVAVIALFALFGGTPLTASSITDHHVTTAAASQVAAGHLRSAARREPDGRTAPRALGWSRSALASEDRTTGPSCARLLGLAAAGSPVQLRLARVSRRRRFPVTRPPRCARRLTARVRRGDHRSFASAGGIYGSSVSRRCRGEQ